MMQGNWRIGSLFGIPLYINASWFFILIFVTLVNAGQVEANPLSKGAAPWWGLGLGLVLALLLFASVLLHELGHSLVAKAQGIRVNSITLFLFGGVAAIDRESDSPGKAFQVAIAGPAVSLTLFTLFLGLAVLVGDWGWSRFALDLARINLVLGLFNLIPGLPLDGGQVLKAAVWQVTGDRYTGGRWAARTGRVVGMTGIVLGLLGALLVGEFSAIWIGLIGLFIWNNAGVYGRVTRLQQVLAMVTAAEVMTRELRIVDGEMSLRAFADEFILAQPGERKPYFAAAQGRYCGLVRPSALQGIDRGAWEWTNLSAIAEPLNTIPTVEEKASLAETILVLERCGESFLTVLSPAGAVAGVINWGDIIKTISDRGIWSLEPQQIRAIRAEGRCPDNLRLGAIARSVAQEKKS